MVAVQRMRRDRAEFGSCMEDRHPIGVFASPEFAIADWHDFMSLVSSVAATSRTKGAVEWQQPQQ
jgi:hypothetical protein